MSFLKKYIFRSFKCGSLKRKPASLAKLPKALKWHEPALGDPLAEARFSACVITTEKKMICNN